MDRRPYRNGTRRGRCRSYARCHNLAAAPRGLAKTGWRACPLNALGVFETAEKLNFRARRRSIDARETYTILAWSKWRKDVPGKRLAHCAVQLVTVSKWADQKRRIAMAAGTTGGGYYVCKIAGVEYSDITKDQCPGRGGIWTWVPRGQGEGINPHGKVCVIDGVQHPEMDEDECHKAGGEMVSTDKAD